LSFAHPWALWALIWLPLLVWLHRRAQPAGEQPWTAWFVLEDGGGGEGRGRRLRAPLLLALRLITVVVLTAVVAGPRFEHPRGTLVLAAGPVTAQAQWAEPITVVRAGRKPAVVTGPVAAVLGPPDWGGALLLGRRVAPGARVVRVEARRAKRRIEAAGAALTGSDVIVTAAVSEGITPVLRQGDRRWPMEARNGDWAVVGPLPAGPAEVVAPGVAPFPVCLPDRSPLPVADTGWPPAVEAVLSVLPGIVRVPADEAVWRVGPAPLGGTLAAPFAPEITWFEFASVADRPAAPLWFAEDLPAPGAVARRWHALKSPGNPVLFAGDAVVADHRWGTTGAGRRFGFDPVDTDLTETAGWPVLFYEASLADQSARGRCQTHEGGQPLLLAVGATVTLEAPDGSQRVIEPQAGRVLVDGLDRAGHWRLRAGGVEATVAVRPPVGDPAVAEAGPVAMAPGPKGPPQTRALALSALVLLGLIGFFSARLRAPLTLVLLGVAALAATDLRLGGRRDGPVVIAVDTSASMPPEATQAAVQAVQAALRGVPTRRMIGANTVQGVGPATGPLEARFDGTTRHGPLVSAAAVAAGPAGAVILISDGRASDGPVGSPVPVFTVGVRAEGPDARLVRAQAVQMGAQVFVRITAVADRPAAGVVHVGGVSVQVALSAQPSTVQAVLPMPKDGVVQMRVAVPGDATPINDSLLVPVRREGRRAAVVVGAPAQAWVTAAGLEGRVVPAGSLAETGAGLAHVGALVLHDVPSASLGAAIVPRLRRWVGAGGVLLLAGRAQAFGPGGWAGSALESLSPLRADPRPPGVGALGVALALDRSGSMAREAGGIGPEGVGALAASVAGALGADDQISVLAFGAQAEVLLPPTGRDRALAAQLPVPAVSRGGTRLLPALRRASQLLRRSAVDARVVVVSDGRFSDAAEVQQQGAAVLSGLRLVAVLVGEDPSRAPLEALVRATDGVMVEAAAEAVPRLTTASVLGAGRGGLLVPGGAVTPGAAWTARVGGTPPKLAARVRVSARASARVLAQAGGDPLLAEWGLGRGRVIALATDRWALAPEQWAALLSPANAPRLRDARLSLEGDWLVYRGSVQDPPPTGHARLLDRAGAHALRWQPVGPGQAVARLPAGPAEVLEISTPTTHGALVEWLSRPVDAERRITGVDQAALTLQAELTGATVLAPAMSRQAAAARRPAGGWSAAVLAGLLALLLAFVDAWRWARPGSSDGHNHL
jgi:Mg-chelatase subunit ChlD